MRMLTILGAGTKNAHARMSTDLYCTPRRRHWSLFTYIRGYETMNDNWVLFFNDHP